MSAAGLEPQQEAKARLMSGLVVGEAALAPTNCLATNPAALKRAYETGGASVAKEMRNFVEALPAQQCAAPAGGRRARALWATTSPPPRPRSLFRNELMELLQS